MKRTVLFAFLLLFLTLTLSLGSGCKPDDPVDPNEEEVITKVELVFTDSANGSNTFTVTYSDPDGDGGNAAVQHDSVQMEVGKTYSVLINLYDESNPSDIQNITTEINAEATEHLFCYTPSGSNVTIVRTDSDGTFPIGIRTNWRAVSAGTISTSVELRHQPDGAKNGTCTPGSTDLLLNFVTVVQ